jgi:hypothetical protein
VEQLVVQPSVVEVNGLQNPAQPATASAEADATAESSDTAPFPNLIWKLLCPSLPVYRAVRQAEPLHTEDAYGVSIARPRMAIPMVVRPETAPHLQSANRARSETQFVFGQDVSLSRHPEKSMHSFHALLIENVMNVFGEVSPNRLLGDRNAA